jgi:hypothetical protein
MMIVVNLVTPKAAIKFNKPAAEAHLLNIIVGLKQQSKV